MDDIATKEQIAEQGYGKTGDIGGQPKQAYWTPDGRKIKAMPDVHEYTRGNGTKIETGTRDANLDKGWLLAKPEKFQLHCPHCDQWHPTQEEIDGCRRKKQNFDARWSKKARKEYGHENAGVKVELSGLKKDMVDLKKTVESLVNALSKTNS